jgi:hypothetical protein
VRGHLTRGNAIKAAAIALALGVVYWGIQGNVPGVGPVMADGERFDPCAQVQHATVGAPKKIKDAARGTACAKGFGQVATRSAPRASTTGFDPGAAAPIRRSGRLPFFAAHVGTLPATGRPTVAGIGLPQGTRHPRYWAADAETPDAITAASRLARAFPKTGLWPIVWDWEDEGPDGYANAHGTPRDAGRLDPLSVLNHVQYSQYGVKALAPARALPARVQDPFAQLAQAPDVLQSSKGQRLLLVAVHRPADAIVQSGLGWSGLLTPAAQTAVARSWEARYGATVTLMTPSTIGFAVAAPPIGDDAARTLAAELRAYAPDADVPVATSGFWSSGWPD